MAAGPIDENLDCRAQSPAAEGADADYETLGEQLARREHRHRADHQGGGGLRRRGALLGRRHRRHALRPLPRTGRAAQHLRQARRLRGHPPAGRATPTVSLHIPWDKVERSRGPEAEGRRARPRLRRDELQHLQDRPARSGPTSFGSLTHTDAAVREQAVAHNIECIEIGRKLGSQGADGVDRRRHQFPRPGGLHPRLRPLSRFDEGGGDRRCRPTGASSSSTSSTSRRSTRR